MSDADFAKGLVDGSQVVSVLLVFLSVLFGIKYGPIIDTLKEGVPDLVQPELRKSFRGEQLRCIFVDVLPVGLPALVLAGLLGPACWRIFTTSKLAFPDFDLVRTLFLAIEICILASVIWSTAVSALLVFRAWCAR